MFAFCVGSIVWISVLVSLLPSYLSCYGRACLALPVILLFAMPWRTGVLDPGDGHGHVSRTDDELALRVSCQRPITETRLWIQKKREELLNSLECQQQHANEIAMRLFQKKVLAWRCVLAFLRATAGQNTSLVVASDSFDATKDWMLKKFACLVSIWPRLFIQFSSCFLLI